MGQYWIIVNLTKKQWIDSYVFGVSKMMEFAWVNNPYLLSIEMALSPGGIWYGDRVWFEGDYNDPNIDIDSNTNLYHLATESWESVVPEGLKQSRQFVVNDTKKLFVDIHKNRSQIHPLPILLACSTGGGGGDYNGNNGEYVGCWVGDVVYTTDSVPVGYTQLNVHFTNGDEDEVEAENDEDEDKQELGVSTVRLTDFVNVLIDKHFPPDTAPKWVNYPMFRSDKFETIMSHIIQELDDKNYVYCEHELMFGYVSDFLDTGSSGIHGAIDDDCEITIPDDTNV